MKKSSLILVMMLGAGLQAQQPQVPKSAATPVKNSRAQGTDPGERAFKANCSRCHSAPEQIPPSITGTVLMHMRVRASLSEADQKAILRFFAP